MTASPSKGLAFALNKLIHMMRDAGDIKNAEFLEKLLIRLSQEDVCVACFGCVSAGKSKLLNGLLGENDLLPVSPLPTSKNFVYIRSRKTQSALATTKTSFSRSEPVRDEAVGNEAIRALCVDTTIDSLEVWRDTPGDICFIDTPGIDRLDQGSMHHSQALLMADLVIFIADYNQVQSQVNFDFLKSLESRNVPYLLVVNQLDKHVSLELTLNEFRARLMQALEHWDLKPKDIYFTSLTEPGHPDSQLELLKESLFKFATNVSSDITSIISTVLRSVPRILELHGEFLAQQQEGEREPHLWVKNGLLEEEQCLDAFRKLEQQIETLTRLPEQIELETLHEIKGLLDNAPLFSYETRELSKSFLESRQQGFKAGLFARSAKTEAEQEKRIQALYKELLLRCQANLTWHLRKILADIPLRYELADEGYREDASEMTVEFTPDTLLETVHPGAVVSGEYVMNYTQDLGIAIKALYRKVGLDWIRRAQEAAYLKIEEQLPGLRQQYEDYLKILGSYAKLRELEMVCQNRIGALQSSWDSQVLQWRAEASTDSSAFTGALLSKNAFAWEHALDTSAQVELKNVSHTVPRKTPAGNLPSHRVNRTSQTVHPTLWNTAQVLRYYAAQTAALPGFAFIGESLRERAARLEQSLFTVALFGAFSAGKSSLANAMLGDIVLPVSPNPTTAAINKILPPTEAYPHGTVKVNLKSLSDLTMDVLASLQVVGLKAADLGEALRLITDLDTRDLQPEAQPHLGFLRAVRQGQALFLGQLGEELSVEFSAFPDYIVQEEKACFVESIELYFSCPLTEMGIVLVDTPGSNSTNARHTNVAFNYIRNSDAVLFLTYYNNPFCRADAQFLSQLGKVKEAFEADKMFFLVNAADLAGTPEELSQVLQHVEKNLRSFDIINPRLFAVSSQLALLAKLASREGLDPEKERLFRQRLKIGAAEQLPDGATALSISGLDEFEKSFLAFIETDLIALAVEAARREMGRVVHQLDGLLTAARTDKSQRAGQIIHFRVLEQSIYAALANVANHTEELSLNQEIDELVYYVKQRVLLRFPDWFNENFFILAKPKEEQPKLAVQRSLNGLLRDLQTDLLQEARATSLRARNFARASLNSLFQKIMGEIQSIDSQCLLKEKLEFAFPMEPDYVDIVWDMERMAKLPSLYKNPRDWVEGDGRNRMREGLLKVLEPQIQNWLDGNRNSIQSFWCAAFLHGSRKLREQIQFEVSEYYFGLTEALESGYDIRSLEMILEALRVEHWII